jgi:hypothetical protein
METGRAEPIWNYCGNSTTRPEAGEGRQVLQGTSRQLSCPVAFRRACSSSGLHTRQKRPALASHPRDRKENDLGLFAGAVGIVANHRVCCGEARELNGFGRIDMDERKNNDESIRGVLFNPAGAQEDLHAGIDAYLEQYRIYVEYADKVTERRQQANSFFLAVNTGIIGIIGFLYSKDSAIIAPFLDVFLSLAGVMLSVFWYRLVYSYRQLNAGKFMIVQLMEEKLPVSPYKAEWHALGAGKDKDLYLPLTHVEVWIPIMFSIFFTICILYAIPWCELVRDVSGS